MAKKESFRMQSPADPVTGERIDLHPITTDEEVIVNFEKEPKLLKDVLNGMNNEIEVAQGSDFVVIQKDFPTGARKPCLWAQVKK